MADTDAYELASQIDRLMRRMNAGVAARAPLFDPERIGPIGGMILLTIADLQPVPLQRVADAMARDKAQLSRVISHLERRGLIERAPCEDDKRSLLLSLTQEGDGFVETIKRTLTEVLGAILEPLDAQEQAQLMALLVKI
ncbi:MAG: MarR family transcriptional regulator [Pseudomonadota bacterium]